MTNGRERYIEENLGLAHSCVRRYTGRGIEYEDLYQTACIGLIKAAERFDEKRGLCFSTYAVPLILGELRQLFRADGSIKVSRRIKELGIKAKHMSDDFFAEHGRSPQLSELAFMLQMTVQDAAEVMCAAIPPDSLDGDNACYLNASVEGFEELAVESIALGQIIDKMEQNDRAILLERYVLEHTQNITAKNLGMTQVQVSRREKKLLGFIKAELEK